MYPEDVAKLIDLLEHFDWSYEMSDDFRYWQAGHDNKTKCHILYAALSKDGKAMVKTWIAEHIAPQENTYGFFSWALNMVGL
jgi:hypothetical protein